MSKKLIFSAYELILRKDMKHLRWRIFKKPLKLYVQILHLQHDMNNLGSSLQRPRNRRAAADYTFSQFRFSDFLIFSQIDFMTSWFLQDDINVVFIST